MSTGTQTMDKRWYIVHAYSNFEKKVAESIREQSKQRGLEDLFELVLVPTEKVTEVRRGRKIDASATITNTMIVVMVVSRRVGHVTLAVSERTSCRNLNGLKAIVGYRVLRETIVI